MDIIQAVYVCLLFIVVAEQFTWNKSDIKQHLHVACVSLHIRFFFFPQFMGEGVRKKNRSALRPFRPNLLLLWLQPGWITVMNQSSVDSSVHREAGWTLISPRTFDGTGCKNNNSGPYGWFWDDQLLWDFKAIIFILHLPWAILISYEALLE